MSVKVKINWDNENVVSESVRIYRADSAFTSASLPPLLTEIVGDIYEYEDLDVIQDQAYFYMLSAKLGEQEVFTECFEVVAEKKINYLSISWNNNVNRYGGVGTTTISYLQMIEPTGSNSSKILLAIVSSFVTITAPAGWTLLSNKNNVFIFWKKGLAENTAHIFTAASSTFIGGCILTFTPNGAFTNVSCVSESVTRSITDSTTPAVAPILSSPINGNCYEIILAKINNLDGSGSNGNFSVGYSKIATQSYPYSIGSLYQFNILVGGRSVAKGGTVGGGSVFLTAGGFPNTLYTQTIQICAY